MGQYEKLLKKFLENPETIDLNGFIKILNKNNFKLVSVRGSHNKYSDGKNTFILAIHNGDLKIGYKTRFKKELLEKGFLRKKDRQD